MMTYNKDKSKEILITEVNFRYCFTCKECKHYDNEWCILLEIPTTENYTCDKFEESIFEEENMKKNCKVYLGKNFELTNNNIVKMNLYSQGGHGYYEYSLEQIKLLKHDMNKFTPGLFGLEHFILSLRSPYSCHIIIDNDNIELTNVDLAKYIDKFNDKTIEDYVFHVKMQNKVYVFCALIDNPEFYYFKFNLDNNHNRNEYDDIVKHIENEIKIEKNSIKVIERKIERNIK